MSFYARSHGSAVWHVVEEMPSGLWSPRCFATAAQRYAPDDGRSPAWAQLVEGAPQGRVGKLCSGTARKAGRRTGRGPSRSPERLRGEVRRWLDSAGPGGVVVLHAEVLERALGDR